MTKMLILKGTSAVWTITAYNKEKKPEPLKDAIITFIVKQNDTIMMEKKSVSQKKEIEILLPIEGLDGTFKIHVNPEDTMNLELGNYIYVIQIIIPNRYFEPISDGFIVFKEEEKEIEQDLVQEEQHEQDELYLEHDIRKMAKDISERYHLEV